MGNKVGTMLLPKSLKTHKKEKPKFQSKVVTCKEIVTHSNGEDIFFTPNSSYRGFNEEEEDNKDENFIQNPDSIFQSEEYPTYICAICVEPKPLIDSFNLKGCTHFYCTNCVISYINSKLDDNVTKICCPISGCKGELEPEFCREILPRDVFDRWGFALCDSLIDNSEKFYCPYKNCSALLIDDSGIQIENSVCPFCKRAICVKCRVPWHSEISCVKFQKLKKKGEDSFLVDLAKRNHWRRCPRCQFYVEKTVGCFYMKCRCGYAFCYKCGTGSSTTTHVCPNPKCKA